MDAVGALRIARLRDHVPSLAEADTRRKPSTGRGSGRAVAETDPVDQYGAGAERTAVYTCLEDLPDGLVELRGRLMREHGVDVFTPLSGGVNFRLSRSGFSLMPATRPPGSLCRDKPFSLVVAT